MNKIYIKPLESMRSLGRWREVKIKESLRLIHEELPWLEVRPRRKHCRQTERAAYGQEGNLGSLASWKFIVLVEVRVGVMKHAHQLTRAVLV